MTDRSYKGHRAILLVDDDPNFMSRYHDWMAKLSSTYAAIYHYSSAHRLYDRKVFDISDLDATLDSIKNSYDTSLDLAIVDFDLVTANGNDAARKIRAKFPDTRIIGNTGGDPTRFDKTLVDVAYDKIGDIDRFYSAIDNNTSIKLDVGIRDIFDRAKLASGSGFAA